MIHCGACMFNRREMLTRIITCQEQGIPITNYGVVITYVHGILNRALIPFRPGAPSSAPVASQSLEQQGLASSQEAMSRGR